MLKFIPLLMLSLIFSSSLSLAQGKHPIQVTAKPLQDVLIERKISANANVVALNDSSISAEITALVTAIHADIGDEVVKDSVLVSLDAVDYELQLAQAKANLQSAKARMQQAQLRLERANELKQSQYISADDLLARETDMAVQKAEFQRLMVAQKIAQRQLDKTQIKAPFNGVVANRSAQLGQLLTPGTAVIQLTQSSDREVMALIPNQLVDSLEQAQSMEFSNQQMSTPVEVIKISPVIKQQSSVQQARFKILGDLPVIGQSGQLTWHLEDSMLPADMVVKRNGKLGVFVVAGNKAKFQVLDDAQEGRPVPIDANNNWNVIVGGRERLQDGDVISVK
jgi:RND family efflux transporter MFP subunit